MGVVHFMPLGKKPGAVTAALAELKHKYPTGQDKNLGHIFEAMVLFTPCEIKEGRERRHLAEPCFFNEYGKPACRKEYPDKNAVEIVLEFMRAEIKPLMTKPTVYWCEAFLNDYEKSFRSAAEALTLKLSKPGSKGKNLWLSLTGGTNIMNAAMMQVALLSGLISKVYYTFVPEDETDYLQPASDNFKFVELPLLKTSFDESHYALLNVLRIMNGEWIDSADLLGILKNDAHQYFAKKEDQDSREQKEQFEREFLTQLDGRGLERETLPNGQKTYRTRLTTDGMRLLAQMEDPIFRALTKRGWTERGELDGMQHSFGWQSLSL